MLPHTALWLFPAPRAHGGRIRGLGREHCTVAIPCPPVPSDAESQGETSPGSCPTASGSATGRSLGRDASTMAGGRGWVQGHGRGPWPGEARGLWWSGRGGGLDRGAEPDEGQQGRGGAGGSGGVRKAMAALPSAQAPSHVASPHTLSSTHLVRLRLHRPQLLGVVREQHDDGVEALRAGQPLPLHQLVEVGLKGEASLSARAETGTPRGHMGTRPGPLPSAAAGRPGVGQISAAPSLTGWAVPWPGCWPHPAHSSPLFGSRGLGSGGQRRTSPRSPCRKGASCHDPPQRPALCPLPMLAALTSAGVNGGLCHLALPPAQTDLPVPQLGT